MDILLQQILDMIVDPNERKKELSTDKRSIFLMIVGIPLGMGVLFLIFQLVLKISEML